MLVISFTIKYFLIFNRYSLKKIDNFDNKYFQFSIKPNFYLENRTIDALVVLIFDEYIQRSI